MLLEDVWFDIIAVVETLKTFPAEKPSPPMEDLDGQITELLNPNIIEDGWKDRDFAARFPNLIFRLFSLEHDNKYSEEQKKEILRLNFPLFMQSPSRGKALLATMQVNQETQLWEYTKEYTKDRSPVHPSKESLITIEIGSFILLGLSLKNREAGINLIIQSIQNHDKGEIFRTYIMNKIITTNSPFRQWVKANKLDTNNDFEWNREVAKLGLRLVPQNVVPKEFKNLENYPPIVVAEFADHLLMLTQKSTEDQLSKIRKSLPEFVLRLKGDDFSNCPKLRDEVQEKLNQV